MNSSSEQDKNADKVIVGMAASIAAAATLPLVVDYPILVSILATGVVSIGLCYGVKFTKDEAWKLIIQIIKAANHWKTFILFGSQLSALILESTGLGYFAGVTIQITTGVAVSYAIGAAAKEYFKGERDMGRIGKTFNDNYDNYNNDK